MHRQTTKPEEEKKRKRDIQRFLKKMKRRYSKKFPKLLPLAIVLFLIVLIGLMNTSESYGAQPIHKLVSRNSKKSYRKYFHGIKNDLIYFQSVHRPREEIKIIELNPPFKKDRLVIVTIVTKDKSDVNQLCNALESLIFLQGDADYLSPVLVFHEGDLTDEQLERIVLSTNRPVGFPYFDSSSFPRAFNHKKFMNSISVSSSSSLHFFGTSKTSTSKTKTQLQDTLGYKQMLRFWISGLWKHPSIKAYDIIMRIDSDSCFKEVNNHLPSFEKHDKDRIFFSFAVCWTRT